MMNFLNKPYPFNDDLKYNAKLVFFISLGILAFILVFQPVESQSFSKTEIIYLALGLAASTFIILSFDLIILPGYMPKIFDSTRWNIRWEIIWKVWTFITISVIYYFVYSKLLGYLIIRLLDIGKIIFLGLIPVIVLIVISYNHLLRSQLKTSLQLNTKITERKLQKDKLVYFDSDYKKDKLIIKADSIILIKSADNYIEVYYESEGKIQRQIIRNTITNVEKILKEFDFIMKCHRSFIVNINRIKEVQGSSQGYKLFFENLSFYALVSQKYVDDLKKHFNL